MINIFFCGVLLALVDVVLYIVIRVPKLVFLEQVSVDPVLVPQIHQVFYFNSVAAVETREVLLLISLALTVASSTVDETRGHTAELTTLRR